MDIKGSLALHAQGKDAWNAWAERMLADRAKMEAAKEWSEDNNSTKAWIAAAAADFSAHDFKSDANFSGFVFPGDAEFGAATFSDDAWFGKATFSGGAWFGEATFSGNAWFGKATFSGDAGFDGAMFSRLARFDKATFSDNARFDKAKFSGDAEFGEATFSGDAGFREATFFGSAGFDAATFSGNAEFAQAVFRSYTSFKGTTFEKDAAFVAMKGESFFTLQDATFLRVPDFGQAHFAEAPRLDGLNFPTNKTPGDGDDISARWRALKRLAIQGHDHEREQLFFANEIKALRGTRDKPWPNPINLFRKDKSAWPGGGRYWGGVFYQVFSDFGRSMLRPLMGWAVAAGGSAFYYYSLSRPVAAQIPSLGDTCKPIAAAIYLAVHKGTIVAGFGGSEKLIQAYICLYGEYGGDRHLPLIPDAVVYVGLGQTVFSAAMIFFFLLAVRNQFRIK